MKENQLEELIQKYLSGTASSQERELVDEWYQKVDGADIVWDLDTENLEDVKKRIQANIWNKAKLNKNKSVIKLWYSVAAAVAVLLVACFTVYTWGNEKEFYSIAKAPIFQVENRYVILSDSSVVILRPGGELKVSEDFGKSERNVELIGEAYFDVRPNKDLPFVIKTGKIKTTVLGTAFSIKARPTSENIEVLVDHGKVKVENEKKVLGVLLANQKITVGAQDFATKELHVIGDKNATKNELAWKEEDVHFEAVAFGELIERLERRYDVRIEFANSKLAECRMSGVFQGTENLEDILTNLCLTSNTTFRISKANHFEILGENCF